MQNLYEYVKMKLGIDVNESVANKNFEKCREVCAKYLAKYKIYVSKDIDNMSIDGDWSYYTAITFNAQTNLACALLWKQGQKSTDLDGIVFYDDASALFNAKFNGVPITSVCSVKTAGVSLVKIFPLIKDVLTGRLDMSPASIIGALDGYEISESVLDEFGRAINEAEDDYDELVKQRNRVYTRLKNAQKRGQDTKELQAELDDLRERVKNCRVGGSSRTEIENEGQAEIDEVEEEFTRRATPEERFKDMERYVNMVLTGMQPSLIVSGAPGVGKTYRISKMIEKRHTLYDDYIKIKGKETPQKFFMTLFEYHEEGNIILIDDADDLMTDETCVNLLKAATDSDEVRTVSYGTTHTPVANDDLVMLHPDWNWDKRIVGGKEVICYPAHFEFEGSIIIITNMRAGQIDTAIRNRAIICDLDFTTEEVLGILKSLLPAIAPKKLTIEDKMKAYDYFVRMSQSKAKMKLSIRNFVPVATFFRDCGDDVESAERMCREQMKNQSDTSKKRY